MNIFYTIACMDSGASHNLMPKIVMEKLGLQIKRPYHDLYSFDARKVRCLGMIKDLVVHLSQIPVKSVLMDIVVEDVPVNYGMLLSRSWERKLGGSLQMDMTYATIPVFGGETRRLYRETNLLTQSVTPIIPIIILSIQKIKTWVVSFYL
jgi:hypothetical protein